MLEIERKYLVRSLAFKKDANSKKRIVQGFLSTDPERTVRVRIAGDQAFITVKGKSDKKGMTRFEWELRIPTGEAEGLLNLCSHPLIEKIRYLVPEGPHTFEVDEFLGENKGLIIAEVELKEEEENLKIPSWVGEEVTGQLQYYNSQLIKKPFKLWKLRKKLP